MEISSSINCRAPTFIRKYRVTFILNFTVFRRVFNQPPYITFTQVLDPIGHIKSCKKKATKVLHTRNSSRKRSALQLIAVRLAWLHYLDSQDILKRTPLLQHWPHLANNRPTGKSPAHNVRKTALFLRS